jgi:hypothetical protein
MTTLLVARVPLIDLKFLDELAAGDAGTSNRRHRADRRVTRGIIRTAAALLV